MTFSSGSFSNEYKDIHTKKSNGRHLLNQFVKAEDLTKAGVFDKYVGGNDLLERFLASGGPSLRTILLPGPLALGMYIGTKKPEHLYNRTELLQRYFPDSKFSSTDPNVKIGFTYSKGDDASEEYIRAVVKWAETRPTERFAIISRWPAPHGINVPSNVDIRQHKSMAFADTKAFIAVSTMPILVTGDMSLTLAIEYEKELFYEKLEHKFRIEEDLRHFPDLANLPNISLESSSKGLGSEAAVLKGERDTAFHQILAGFEWYNKNAGYVENGLRVVRARISLPARFGALMHEVQNGRDANRLAHQTLLGGDHAIWDDTMKKWLDIKEVEKFRENTKWTSTRALIIDVLDRLRISYKLIWKKSQDEKMFERKKSEGGGTAASREVHEFLQSMGKDGVTLQINTHYPF